MIKRIHFLYNCIKKIYTNSFTNIFINNFKSNKLVIKSGIKQGCPLSNMLYILAIEELMIRIKMNPNIKGYIVNNGLNRFEIKATVYADDVTGYVVDERSTKEFFQEFSEWGDISGASVNKDKTEIMDIQSKNKITEMKILGVVFDNNGISKKNLVMLSEKIKKSIEIWNSIRLNIIEKIVVAKTFIFSKFWFLANFLIIDKNYIKIHKSLIFKFIWNNSQELIKRNTLIMPYERGGLNMFHLESRLKTINIKNFLYFIKNKNRVFFSISICWLKFYMKDFLNNFNIIPGGSDVERPEAYKRIIEDINDLKKINKNFILDSFFYKSKNIYITISKQYEERAKCEILERENFEIDWKKVYKKNLDKRLSSDLRSTNYKILNRGISSSISFSKNQKCPLCKKENKNLHHLFLNCRITKYCFNLVKRNFEFSNKDIKKETLFYYINIDDILP